MLLEFFADLKRVDGINCIAVFDKKLNLIERWSTKYISEKISQDIRMDLAQIFTITENYLEPAQEFILVTRKEKIFCQNFERFYLLVLFQLKVNVQLVRLIASIGWGQMQKDKKVQKFLRKLPHPPTDLLTESQVDDVEAKYLAQLENRNNK